MKLSGLFCLLVLWVVAESTISPSDQSALSEFYSSLTSKGLLTWDTNLDLCLTSNSGVFDFVPAVLCDTQTPQRVVGLILNSKKLSGQLDGSLAKLPFLDTLVLSDNNFSGVIPDFSAIGTLTSLTLAENAFSGVIPSSLGSVTSLTSIDLSGNNLVGPIPTELGYLKSLNQLYIGDNPLASTLPTELGKLTSLSSFSASGASLHGAIPTQIFSLANLESLYLADNSLTGGLPTQIGLAINLNILDMKSNTGLGGSIPIQIGTMANLGSVDLSNCGLTNSIPTQVGTLSFLDTFIVSHNSLSGQIPVQITNSPFLVDLQLEFNSFTGTIPSSLSSIPTLRVLFLSGGSNSFCPLPNYSTWASQTDYPGPLNCNSCSPTPCVNGGICTFISNTFGCSCPLPYYNSTCQSVYTCPLNNRLFADYPVTIGGSVATGFCTTGWTGSPTRACGPTGVWSTTINGVCIRVCEAATHMNATFPKTINGQTANGTCQTDLIGSVTRFCNTNGTWGPVVGTCFLPKCPLDNTGTGNANWAATRGGQNATGTCLSGFAGTPTRLCQNDGTWATVNNPCYKICAGELAFNASWVDTVAGTTVPGTCVLGFAGTPTRLCKNDGTWAPSLTSGSCLPIRCPVDFNYAHTDFPEGGAPGQWVTGVCAHGWSGTGTRFCGADGVWSPNFSVRCTANRCPAIDEGYVSWPLTMFDLIINRDCPAGFTGRASRTCGTDGVWGAIRNPCIPN